jgi:N-glycosylase/DNA lyase
VDYTGVYETNEGVEIAGLEYFSLDVILDCGQCFRWEKLASGRWQGVAKGRARELVQRGSSLIILSADIAEFEGLWRDYFDFGRDYNEVRRVLCEDDAMRSAVAFSPGMRVLRQEPWEALCSFIISQNNNIKRIKGIIARLCERFGESVPGGFAFPKPEALAILTEADLAPLRCGFRAKYILDAAQKVSAGEVELEQIRSLPSETAAAELMKIKGVGPKVAACALLYGLGRAESLPVDVWMKRALAEFYPDGMPEALREIQGLGQQYLFHYVRNRGPAIF